MGPILENGHLHSEATPEEDKKLVQDVRDVTDKEAELPVVLTDTVPLGLLVDRVSSEVYKELQVLAETLPNMSDLGRKQSIIQWIGNSGRRLLRLAVLSRWSGNAPLLKKLASIQGFLQAQNDQFNTAVSFLADAHHSLVQARVRNYDLLSATDLLSVGSYQQLPAVLGTWAEPDQSSPKEALGTLVDLNRVLRHRLAVLEVVPAAMKRYTIADGRVTFRVPDLFEAALTLGGDDESDRWYLWAVRFLKPESASTYHSYAVELDEMLHAQLVEQSNRVLVDDPPEGVPKLQNQDKAPLVRLYEFLETLALNFKLEQIHAQALQLTQSYGWVGNVTVTQARDRRSIDVSYWTDAKSSQKTRLPGGPQSKDARPPPRVNLAIADQEESERDSLSLNDDLTSRSRLVYQWYPEVDELATAPEARSCQTFQSSQTLEQLLYHLIRKHVDHVMRRMYKQVLASCHFPKAALTPRFSKTSPPVLVSSFDVSLQKMFSVRLQIPEQSGHLDCLPLNTTISDQRSLRVVRSGKLIGDGRATASEALHRLRASLIAENIEHQVSSLGLRLQKRVHFKPTDQSRFGSLGRLPILINLPHTSVHCLAVVIAEDQLLFAVVSLNVTHNERNMPEIGLGEIGWIDSERLGISANNGFELSLHQLERLHKFACARISSYALEQQLYARQIPFQHAWGKDSTGAAVGAISRLEYPICLIRLVDLMPGLASVSHSIIAAVMVSNDTQTCFKIKYVLRLQQKALQKLSSPLPLPSNASLQASTGILTFEGELQEFFKMLGLCWKEFRRSQASFKPTP